MTGDAMGTDGDGAAGPRGLAEDVAAWQTAGKGRRTSKKTKRVAIASPQVDKTPQPRRERGAHGRGASGAASEEGAAGDAATAHGADQARSVGGSTEVALKRALTVLEGARACFDEVLATDLGGMTSGLRARLAASREAMETICAGMALQRLRAVAAENKRAAQDLARARKDLEKERQTQRPAAGRQGRTWAQVAGQRGPAPEMRAREPIGWVAERTFFLHPADAA